MPLLVGRRTGILVPRALNRLQEHEMDDPADFFAASIRSVSLERVCQMESDGEVPLFVLDSVQAWWSKSTSDNWQACSVSTAPDSSHDGSSTSPMESEIETTSMIENDSRQNTSSVGIHDDPSMEFSQSPGGDISDESAPTDQDSIIGKIVIKERLSELSGSEKEMSVTSPLSDESISEALSVEINRTRSTPEAVITNIDALETLGSDDFSNDDLALAISSVVESLKDSKSSSVESTKTSAVNEEDEEEDQTEPDTPQETIPGQDRITSRMDCSNRSAFESLSKAEIWQRKQERARVIDAARKRKPLFVSDGASDDEVLHDYEDFRLDSPPPAILKRKQICVASNNESASMQPKTTKKKQGKKNPNPYATVFPSGQPEPLSYSVVPVADLQSQSPENKLLRRSKRVKVAPLKHWCGERMVYGPNDFGSEYDGVRNMSVVTAITFANPVVYKRAKSRKKDFSKLPKGQSCDGIKQMALSSLHKQFRVLDGTSANLRNAGDANDTIETQVVSYFDEVDFSPLDVPSSDEKSKLGVKATFGAGIRSSSLTESHPGFFTGSVVLPIGSSKALENVGLSLHIFTVVFCQPKSLQFAIGPSKAGNKKSALQHFFVSPGDNFQVPPGNQYRLQNHSKTSECILSWTITRKLEPWLDDEESTSKN